MKRIILIVAVTAIAWAGFAFFGKQTGSEAHAHEEHEHEEEVDFDHILLTAKQVSTVDLKIQMQLSCKIFCVLLPTDF